MTVTARLEDAPEIAQRLRRPRQVFQHEADENVVESRGRERRCVDVRLRKGDICEVGGPCLLPRGAQRNSGDIHGHDGSAGTLSRESHGLRPDAAAGLEDPTPWRITRVRVEKGSEGLGLVAEALGFPGRVSVYIVRRGRHGLPILS